MRFFQQAIPTCVVSSILFATPSFAWTSWVGVLEDWPVTPTEIKTTDGSPAANAEIKTASDAQYEARIRPLFIRSDKNTWQAAPKATEEKPIAPLPKAFSWDVCFSGRGEGQITALLTPNPTESAPPYILRPEDRAPWRTRRSNDFSGQSPAPVYKPILLMSSLNSSCKDPEKWKQGGSEKAKSHLTAIITELKKQFAFQSPDLPSYEFKDQEVKIFKTWAAPKKGIYVAIKTRPKDPTTETFFISINNEISHLGRNMLMVDASDIDGDGATELVFKRRSEKKDIYDLVAGPKSLAQAVWTVP